MLFESQKTYNIRVKWKKNDFKRHIREMMFWKLPTHRTLGKWHFGEQLFREVFWTKNAYHVLGVRNKVGELSRLKHMVPIEDVASKKHRRSILGAPFICPCATSK